MPAQSGKYRFSDSGAGVTVTADTPCAADNVLKRAECPNDDAASINMGLGAGNDLLHASGIATDIFSFGGAGNDDVTLGEGDDYSFGLDGNDITHGGQGNDSIADGIIIGFFFGTAQGSGNDQMYGDDGNDFFRSGSLALDGAGADIINGGPGVDTLEYVDRPGDLSVSIDNPVLGDGQPGEGDQVMQMEIVRTLGGNDLILDSSAAGLANVFYGMGGNDTLDGGRGNDRLYGGDDSGTAATGDDVLDGGEGADLFSGGDGIDSARFSSRSAPVTVILDGAPGDGEAGENDNVLDDVETVLGGGGADMLGGSDGRDTLRGGGSADVVDGGDGVDVLAGEDGDDLIAARDGAADTVTCGPGSDMVNADREDSVDGDCELVDRGPADSGQPGDPQSGGGAADDAPILFLVVEGKQRVRRGLRLHAACSEDCRLALAARLPATLANRLKLKRAIARGSRSLKTAQQVTLSLRPAKRAVRRLRRLRRVKVTLAATASDSGGHVRRVTRRVTLRR